jgi:protein arginine N-methyltransferase 1
MFTVYAFARGARRGTLLLRRSTVNYQAYYSKHTLMSCSCPSLFFKVEYTDMASHAKSVMEANGLSDIVTVIQGAVEEIELPMEKDGLVANDGDEPTMVVDIIVSEWMGYFLLRESMLDSLIRARDKFMRPKTGLMFPSHTTMYWAPVNDEDERKICSHEYSNSMNDWYEFAEGTKSVYGVDMNVLEKEFDREQKEYYMLSSRWSELSPRAVLAEPVVVKHLDMVTCTIDDSRGILPGAPQSDFKFTIDGEGPFSGFAGWFTADFKSRTDEVGADVAPKMRHPAFLSTGPENGYTHWGQQTFYLPSSIPLLRNQVTTVEGNLEMMRTKANSRLYNCRITYTTSRSSADDADGKEGPVLNKSEEVSQIYQIP